MTPARLAFAAGLLALTACSPPDETANRGSDTPLPDPPTSQAAKADEATTGDVAAPFRDVSAAHV